MRKSLLLIIALAPLAIVVGATSTIAAEPTVSGSSAAQPAPDALDLNAIPIKPVTGPQSVRGVGGDDEDDDVLAEGDGDRECTANGRKEACDNGDDD